MPGEVELGAVVARESCRVLGFGQALAAAVAAALEERLCIGFVDLRPAVVVGTLFSGHVNVLRFDIGLAAGRQKRQDEKWSQQEAESRVHIDRTG